MLSLSELTILNIYKKHKFKLDRIAKIRISTEITMQDKIMLKF